jgi:hypothetical protein
VQRQTEAASKPKVSHKYVPTKSDNEESDDDDDADDDADVRTDSNGMNNILSHGSGMSRAGELKVKSKEFTQLKEGLLRSRRAVNVLTGSDADSV